MPRLDPFTRLVNSVIDQRKDIGIALCNGRWDTLSEAQRLVGQYKALTGVIEEMRTIAGPGTDFGEEDL